MKKLVLVGVNGERITLMEPGVARDGVALKEWPELDFPDTQHLSDLAVGVVGARWRGLDIKDGQINLKCKVVGENTRALVAELLDALGDGSKPCALEAVDGDSVRTCGVRVSGVSKPNWWGSVSEPLGATVDVVLWAEVKLWELAPVSQPVTTVERLEGVAWVETGTPRPVWPVVSVDAGPLVFGIDGVLIELPARDGGWRIDTDPTERSITGAAGGGQVEFQGEVPHWPKPPVPVLRGGKWRVPVWMHLEQGQTVTVDVVPIANRAWE